MGISFSVGYRQIGGGYFPSYLYVPAGASAGNVVPGEVQSEKAFRPYAGQGQFGVTNGGLALATTTIQPISSSTNASPIVLTVPSAAGFALNDSVIVGGHTVNTAANNTPSNPTWIVSAIGGTTITLFGSTGNGVGGATGVVYKTTGTNRPAALPHRRGASGAIRSTLGQTNGT